MMEELSYHILDIVQNSFTAGALNVRLEIIDSNKDDILSIIVEDDGKGMNHKEIEIAQNPFYTTKKGKRVGLGIPLLKESCEMCEGRFEIVGEKGKGTKVKAVFKKSHIDRPPMGNLKDTILTLIIGAEKTDIDFIYKKDGKIFNLNTKEIKKQIGDLPINNPDVIRFIKGYLDENLENE